MEELIAQAGGIKLYKRQTPEWLLFRVEVGEEVIREGIGPVLEALTLHGKGDSRAICVDLNGLANPNSRMLASLVGLLSDADEQPRRVALVSPGKEWMDMLDILGVKSSFVEVGAVDDIVYDGDGDA